MWPCWISSAAQDRAHLPDQYLRGRMRAQARGFDVGEADRISGAHITE
ncbi:hypothetical protein I551_1768 [Mycobacterium ulcerans str. Harvey]|uniref:Uncharacterized protein n=1 Tax=Mycobacterium ulcerans str. Harvey TaxID=1299332 RepID=A0ABP3AL37_MYCUL|nr:hypothetical protein I551_1768 [Mycobacterium ulcerans str. Harvey]